MSKLNPSPDRASNPGSRQIDPDIAKSARRSGVPDVSTYDTSAIDRTGPSNLYLLVAVLVVVGVLLGIFYAFVR
jgi:hypothetical protein